MMAVAIDEPSRGKVHWIRYTLASFVALAAAAYVGAILGGWITAERRLDTNSILLIVLAAGVALLIVNPSGIEGVTAITFGSFKAEFAQLRSQVDSVSAVLALLLTDNEQNQLLKLRRGDTVGYFGSHDLRTRLRKLRDMRLLQMTKDEQGNDKRVAAMTDNTPIDLSNFLSLTELGRRIVDELERIEKEKVKR
jgi:hypothetical protein